MLVQRIVGVLCCLALCGCLWQPPRYVPPPPPSPVIQAKDYVVPWPEVSWGTPPIDVRFVFPENEKEFPREMYARLEQRHFLRPVEMMDKNTFVVFVSKFDVDIIDRQIETELLYFRPSTYAELIQFVRVHYSSVMRARANIAIKHNGKTIYKGMFEGKVPDGKIYCINFEEQFIEPGWRETIYLWEGVRQLCRTRNKLTDIKIMQKKMAEIFAGDMEELIIGLMKP